MLDIATNQENGPVNHNDIVSRQDGVSRYLSSTLRLLRNSGLVEAVRGSKGGYWLSTPSNQITLADIYEAVHGKIDLCPCLDEPEGCEKTLTCKTRKVWDEISDTIWTKLQEVSLADLQDCNCPNSEDKRDIFLMKTLWM